MSPGWLVVVLVAALALASVSVRALVVLPALLRPGRLVVLLLSASLGVALAGTLGDWDLWPVGLIVGLAVVELGPTVLSGAKAFVRALVKRKSSGDDEPGGAP